MTSKLFESGTTRSRQGAEEVPVQWLRPCRLRICNFRSLRQILKDNLVIAAEAKYLELGMEVSREKIAYQMKTQIRKVRKIIYPQFTPRGLAQRAIGTSTANHPSQTKVSNAIWNPIWSPIWNQSHQQSKETGRSSSRKRN